MCWVVSGQELQPVMATGHSWLRIFSVLPPWKYCFCLGLVLVVAGVIDLELTLCGLSGNKLDDEIEKFIRF